MVGQEYQPGNAFKVVGAHTDSPALKVKPVSKRETKGYLQVGIETYGGGLWHTWLDRDLGIAGRVVIKEADGFQQRLLHINRPLLRVPSLCIHLKSAEERNALKINPEEHLTAILGETAEQLNQVGSTSADGLDNRHVPELIRALARELGVEASTIVDFDLTLADTQKASIGGVNSEFLFSPRLDNQMHCFTSLEALLNHASSDELQSDDAISMICLFDHEEIGSDTLGGAGSPIMRDAVERISEVFQTAPGSETFKIALDKSLLVSADGSHAIHPNFQGKHEMNHQPKMNGGTVIKSNANQRYATNGVTGFIMRELARRAKVPIQEFVVRQDSPCGSTIGPILAAHVGIRTVDLGISQLSMHSCRETCGVHDLLGNSVLLHEFFKSGLLVDRSLKSNEVLEGEVSGLDVSKV